MARTQKNKATMGHLGMLKARIAKLRRELITPKGGGGGAGEGFDVAKTGDARIGFVGKVFGLHSFLILFLFYFLVHSRSSSFFSVENFNQIYASFCSGLICLNF